MQFADPFFTNIPPAKRPTNSGVGKRMTGHIATNLEPIPAPQRDPAMTPFVHLIALYSNVGEGPGFISGKTIGNGYGYRRTTDHSFHAG